MNSALQCCLRLLATGYRQAEFEVCRQQGKCGERADLNPDSAVFGDDDITRKNKARVALDRGFRRAFCDLVIELNQIYAGAGVRDVVDVQLAHKRAVRVHDGIAALVFRRVLRRCDARRSRYKACSKGELSRKAGFVDSHYFSPIHDSRGDISAGACLWDN